MDNISLSNSFLPLNHTISSNLSLYSNAEFQKDLLWWIVSVIGLNCAGTIGNILLLLAMAIHKPLRQSSSCSLMVHCIAIDLYQTLVAVPAQIIPVYLGPRHSLPALYCRFLSILVYSSSWASMHASCALAVHRLIATIFPYQFVYFTKSSSIVILLLVPWVLSLFIAMFPTVEYGMKVIRSSLNGGCTTIPTGGTDTILLMYTVIGTYLPTVLMRLCYVIILAKTAVEYRRHQNKTAKRVTALRRRSEISLTLFISFLWHCATLYPLMITLTFYSKEYSQNMRMQLALKGLINVFSAVNPAFYWASSRLFQNGIREVLAGRWWTQRNRVLSGTGIAMSSLATARALKPVW